MPGRTNSSAREAARSARTNATIKATTVATPRLSDFKRSARAPCNRPPEPPAVSQTADCFRLVSLVLGALHVRAIFGHHHNPRSGCHVGRHQGSNAVR